MNFSSTRNKEIKIFLFPMKPNALFMCFIYRDYFTITSKSIPIISD